MQTLLFAAWLAAAVSAPSVEAVRIDWSHVTDRNADLAAVRGEYVAAINAKDARGASAVYTPDALALFGDATLVKGAAALAERLQEGVDGSGAIITLTPRRFSVSEDLGSEIGTFTVTASKGDAPVVEGAYVAVYSRSRDGRWRIAMEVRTNGREVAAAVW
jgi:ketosteroid isomerase-like protein